MSKPTRDIFFCHASEDKDDVVRPLVEASTEAGVSCWYDEAEIRWGDSITQKVNEGLGSSKFVVVVFSTAFVQKNWPQKELNSVLNQEASSGEVNVLPLLVGTEKEKKEILSKYPLDFEFSFKNIAIFNLPKELCPKFIFFYLLHYRSVVFERLIKGAAQPFLGLNMLRHMRVPVPPLGEQHRIVSKVDELMALFDGLDAQLATSQRESRRLLEAVLDEALNMHAGTENGAHL